MSTYAIPATAIPSGTWTVDQGHSKVGFAVKHMGIANVRGEFTEFDGVLEIGDDLGTAKVRGTVKAGSVDTNESQRDAHLRSPDFFDAETHPELASEWTRVGAVAEETFRSTGALTLRGWTNGLVLAAEVNGVDIDPYGNEKVGLEVTGQLSRGDYGMKFNQA